MSILRESQITRITLIALIALIASWHLFFDDYSCRMVSLPLMITLITLITPVCCVGTLKLTFSSSLESSSWLDALTQLKANGTTIRGNMSNLSDLNISNPAQDFQILSKFPILPPNTCGTTLANTSKIVKTNPNKSLKKTL